MTLNRSSDLVLQRGIFVRGAGPHKSISAGGAPTAGLEFLGNNAANSDVRLVWSGADLLPRQTHTAMWRIRYGVQLGYYAVTWHSKYTGSFFPASNYEYGVHPYPCDGTYGGTGQMANGTSSSGTDQYFEIAGFGGIDHIALPMEPFVINEPGNGSAPAQAGTWLVQARTCEVINGGTELRHRAYPDVVNSPSSYLEFLCDVAGFPTPSDPAFYIGASDWTESGGANSETPCGVINGIRLFDACLAQADLEAEAAAIGDNTPASANGASSVWYINDSPTPSDVTAKAGSHPPAWANARRPLSWAA